MARSIHPCGCWPSPVTAEMVAGKSLRFGALKESGDGVCWTEGRPEEGGRGAIMAVRPCESPRELLPEPFSARSRVHEYGGGEMLPAGGTVFFVNDADQDIYALRHGAEPCRLTDAPDVRFADMAHDGVRKRLIAVAERHAGKDGYPENFLCAVNVADGLSDVTPLVTGRDFFAAPRLGPDGNKLAWLAWDLPHMPWEAAALHVAELGADGTPGTAKRIAGGEGSACFQPEWTRDGRLLFVWDRTGWGNLYGFDGEEIAALAPCEAELMRPHWVFGMRSWTLLEEDRAALCHLELGEARLELLDLASGAKRRLELPFRGLGSLARCGGGLAVVGASDTEAPAIAALDLDTRRWTVLRRSAGTGLAARDISTARTMRFTSDDGESVYALYYPPANAHCRRPEGERPPVIITVHGGPTGQAGRGLKLKTQFWTSRGFGVCDVDYSGSAGYSRAYRARLDGQWGVRDVADVAAAARHLTEQDLADPGRLLISGGSAGGYTVLMALARLDIFAAGACAYAVADLAQLQRITHKFEAGYLYGLTGTDERNCEKVFAARSPVNLAESISSPVIFFQGDEDKVVPPAQSRAMHEALKARGIPTAYMEFAGEGHGFRRAETIIAQLTHELAFYARILGLEPADPLPSLSL